MTIGQKIRKLRRERDWTQAELGERAGINYRNITRYESGKLRPGLKVLRKLAAALEVPLDDFMEAQEQAAPAGLRDPELLQHFRDVEQMPEEDRAAIKRLLQAMVIKHQVQNLGRIA